MQRPMLPRLSAGQTGTETMGIYDDDPVGSSLLGAVGSAWAIATAIFVALALA
jgi:hypothetical protein